MLDCSIILAPSDTAVGFLTCEQLDANWRQVKEICAAVETAVTPSLAALTDTAITNPQDGDILVYSGGFWVNQPDGAGGLWIDNGDESITPDPNAPYNYLRLNAAPGITTTLNRGVIYFREDQFVDQQFNMYGSLLVRPVDNDFPLNTAVAVFNGSEIPNAPSAFIQIRNRNLAGSILRGDIHYSAEQGSPENVVQSEQGSLLMNRDGRVWVKAIGSTNTTGWHRLQTNLSITPGTGIAVNQQGDGGVQISATTITQFLDDLNDVTITNAVSGQILQYTGAGQWVNVNTTEIIPLGGLLDVTVTNPSEREILRYVGGEWVNSAERTITIDSTGAPIANQSPTNVTLYSLVAAPGIAITPNGNTIEVGTDAPLGDIVAFDQGGTVPMGAKAGNTATVFSLSQGNAMVVTQSVNTVNVIYDGTIADQGDVVLTSLTSGQILEYNGTNWVNVPTPSGGGGATTFESLTDVAAYDTITAGQVPIWDGSQWQNGWFDVRNLGEVNITSPQTGDALIYDGVNFTNRPIDYSDIANTPTIPTVLNDLTDVNSPSPPLTVDAWLKYDDNAGEWTDAQIVIFGATGQAGGYLPSRDLVLFNHTGGTGITVSNSGGSTLQYDWAADIGDLGDVSIGTPNNVLDILIFDGGANWEHRTLAFGNALFGTKDATNLTIGFNGNIGDLGDVDTTTTTPVDGNVLTYDGVGGEWIPAAPSGGGSVASIGDIGDVTITTPSAGQTLEYNGSIWVNATPTGASPWTDTGTELQYLTQPVRTNSQLLTDPAEAWIVLGGKNGYTDIGANNNPETRAIILIGDMEAADAREGIYFGNQYYSNLGNGGNNILLGNSANVISDPASGGRKRIPKRCIYLGYEIGFTVQGQPTTASSSDNIFMGYQCMYNTDPLNDIPNGNIVIGAYMGADASGIQNSIMFGVPVGLGRFSNFRCDDQIWFTRSRNPGLPLPYDSVFFDCSGAMLIPKGSTAQRTSQNLESAMIRFNTNDNEIEFYDNASIWRRIPSFNVVEAVKLAAGTTAQRPSSPTDGAIRFNTTTSVWEGWNGTEWRAFTTTTA